jgi:hypothetical protein
MTTNKEARQLGIFSNTDFFVALLLAGFLISPLLQSGYYGDDTLNSLTSGIMAEKGRTLFEQFKSDFEMFASTRISLFHFYRWGFLIFSNLLSYKLFLMGMVLLNLVAFSYLVRLLTQSRKLALITLILPPLFVQFRNYGDPVLLFHASIQTNLLGFVGILVLYKNFLNSGRRRYQILSLLLYLAVLNLGEFSYFYFYFPMVMFFFHEQGPGRLKKSLIAGLPFFITGACMLTATLVVRMIFRNFQNGVDPVFTSAYQPNLDVFLVAKTLLKQIFASVPLSYYTFDPHNLFQGLVASEFAKNLYSVLIAFLGYGLLWVYALLYPQKSTLKTPELTVSNAGPLLIFMGLGLLLIPNGVISLSPKYQAEIIWGIGYNSIFAGHFGLSFFLMGVALLFVQKMPILKKLHRALTIVVALAAAVVASMNVCTNSVVVATANSFWFYPRSVLEASFRAGLFEGLPSHPRIFLNSDFPWDITTFFRTYTKIQLNQKQYEGGRGRFLVTRGNEGSLNAGNKSALQHSFFAGETALARSLVNHTYGNFTFDFDSKDNVYYIDYYSDAANNGYVFLAKLKHLQTTNDSILGATAERVRVFVRTPDRPGGYRNTVLYSNWMEDDDLGKTKAFILNENALTQMGSGLGWKLLEVSAPRGNVLDLRLLSVNSVAKFLSPSLFWKPVAETSLKLKPRKQQTQIVHVGFENSLMGSAIELPKVQLGEVYTLEMLVQPERNLEQAPFAHIVGNHPGRNNFEGFVVQQINRVQNRYSFSWGDGQSWRAGGEFTLDTQQVSYLSISVSKTEVTISINGKIVSRVANQGVIKNSDLPVGIGNFVNGDRPFIGRVSEFRILSDP